MKIDIVRNLPAQDYHAIRAASASRIKELMRSPAHLKHMDENRKDGDALRVGEALHTLVLEPETFEARFAAAPDLGRRTSAGKAAWQGLQEQSVGKTILTYDQHLSVTGMAHAIGLHPMAMSLLQGRTETELTLMWKALDMRCKARIDAYNLEERAVIDIKTTDDASADGFARSVARFKYHVQAAWYLDAMCAAGFDAQTFIFAVVEKAAPYGVGLYELDEASIEEGRIQIAKHLPILANCEATNEWPAYDVGVRTISLPRWSVKGEEVTL